MDDLRYIGDASPDTVVRVTAIDSMGGRHSFETSALFRVGEDRTTLYVVPMMYNNKYLDFKKVTSTVSCVIDGGFYGFLATEITLARVNQMLCHRIVCTRPRPSTNRREFVRIDAEFPGELSVLENELRVPCTTHDISCSGMSVVIPSNSSLDRGASAVISFRNKDSGQRYIVFAVAMHITAINDAEERVGFKFGQEYTDVNALIANLQRGELKHGRT